MNGDSFNFSLKLGERVDSILGGFPCPMLGVFVVAHLKHDVMYQL